MTLLNDLIESVVAGKGLLCLSGILLYSLVVAAKTILTWYRLRHFKGPFWAAFSKWWLVRHVVGGSTFHLDVYDVCKKYGVLETRFLDAEFAILTFSCRINCTDWSRTTYHKRPRCSSKVFSCSIAIFAFGLVCCHAI
jgi:hypothetical protein